MLHALLSCIIKFEYTSKHPNRRQLARNKLFIHNIDSHLLSVMGSMVEVSVLLERVSKATGEVKEKIIAKGIIEYLKSNLREVNAKIIELCNKYGVTSAKEMEEKYKRGELEEENTWRDFFRLSHLEERKQILEKLLEEISVE